MNFRENIEAMVVRLIDGSLIIANIRNRCLDVLCSDSIFLTPVVKKKKKKIDLVQMRVSRWKAVLL